jgi:glyoxylate reductase
MAPKTPKVVVTRKLPDAIELRMMELFDTTLNETDAPFTREQLVEAVATADVLVPTLTDMINADILSQAGSNLKLIANFGTGSDHIDIKAAQSKGITVTNTPGVLTEDTADITMALVLGVLRRMSEGARLLRSGGWAGWSPASMLGQRVAGKRLGIVGMGRIGQAVAHRARAFGMSIHYHNRNRVLPKTEEALEATYWESLDQMLARMDVVSVNCPHTPATFHLLSARRLHLMQPHAVLINTARGEIVDELALVQMLEQGAIAGVGLDVFEREPAMNPKLLSLDNVVLLPHMGSATQEGRMDMGEKVIINIKTYADGHNPPDRVLEGLL